MRKLNPLGLMCCALLCAQAPGLECAARAQTVVVAANPAQVANTFSPIRSLGGAIDRLREGAPALSRLKTPPSKEALVTNTDTVLTNPVLRELLGAGLGPVSYRQNTELMIQAWHWNPVGAWSDPERQQGYFVGSAQPGSAPIRHSWAYPLPHRGNSLGDGNGWSCLTDGNPATYWKSNPYLCRPFTGEDDSLHPQWVMVDLWAVESVNAIRIAWASPYALRYRVQFWTGTMEPFYHGTTQGAWETFPRGEVTDGRGGTVTLKLVSWPLPIRYLRIWMTQSSYTAGTHGGSDIRNRLGYAISELYVGELADDGTFTDLVTHRPDRQQTVTWASSTDPWHAASDLDYSQGDQIGFDLFFTSGITRGLPAMVPIAMLYSTPEDAAAEVEYLYRRHYPIAGIEMGEEADGQHMLPEDYGALYIQFARAIHKLVPQARLGGPAFEGHLNDVQAWPDSRGDVSWLGRFLAYLKSHGAMKEFSFFSFEHYPFQDQRTPVTWSELCLEPGYVSHIAQVWKDDGLPAGVPFYMTEGNMGGRSGEGDVKSALWLADYVGAMMTAGASGTYYFHYMAVAGRPFGFLWLDNSYQVIAYPPQYLAAQLITKEWAQPVDRPHQLYRAASDVRDAQANVLVTAYALKRPDGKWSVMLVNKDPDYDHPVRVVCIGRPEGTNRHFAGPVETVTFGAAQYQWHEGQPFGHADPDGPPARAEVQASAGTVFNLPKASIVVLRGALSAR